MADYTRPTPFLFPESSLAVASTAFQEGNLPLLPVLDGGYLRGVVYPEDLQRALLSGRSPDTPIAEWVRDAELKVAPHWTCEQALRAFAEAPHARAAIVTDEDGRYLGILLPFDLFRMPDIGARPRQAGGMATPFGVYLTTGSVSAGVGPLALATTGALLFTLLTLCSVVTFEAVRWIPYQMPPWLLSGVLNLLPAALFFLILRSLSITRIHGAEHKVVHAIERGEPLTVQAARRMPRVHPRCGTNLAVGATLFIGLVNLGWAYVEELGALIALLATLALWQPIGSLFQQHLTTREPTDRELEAAVRVGRDLVDRYRSSPRRRTTLATRLVASGLPWLMLGATAAALLLYAVGTLFHLESLVL